mmetsp:Transcript_31646/g.46282  ORF Transcript_31646/g.46282 Transcript_31646/m.46282 type:complete len:157 (+) Transcript_31646:2-472(+)
MASPPRGPSPPLGPEAPAELYFRSQPSFQSTIATVEADNVRSIGMCRSRPGRGESGETNRGGRGQVEEGEGVHAVNHTRTLREAIHLSERLKSFTDSKLNSVLWQLLVFFLLGPSLRHMNKKTHAHRVCVSKQAFMYGEEEEEEEVVMGPGEVYCY